MSNNDAPPGTEDINGLAVPIGPGGQAFVADKGNIVSYTPPSSLPLPLTEAVVPYDPDLENRVVVVNGERTEACALRHQYMLLKYKRAGVVQNVADNHARSNKWMVVENWRSKYVPLIKKPLKELSDKQTDEAGETIGSQSGLGSREKHAA